ncbi:CocE/NonD family hydrolase [Gallaecimonas kandeliae]|uniref:CocE/NonD family hydrolase n=1 Tax=Gallaecimonas kandeliae TaxID=3029055 RepID=UPI002648EC4E|nr:CocE/NonD family hydrolase [Gallaecimonas kandeliae]WKE65381.1 CocE/NonD family hydrolase [Gallaecimonas kandeliae]
MRLWAMVLLLGLAWLPLQVTAQPGSDPSIPNPLRQLKAGSRDEVVQLLHDPAWYGKLAAIAKQLPAETVAAQKMFNRTALLSARQEYPALLELLDKNPEGETFYCYRLGSLFPAGEGKGEAEESNRLRTYMQQSLAAMGDEAFLKVSQALNWSIPSAEDFTTNVYKKYRTQATLSQAEAIEVVANTQLMRVLYQVIPSADKIIAMEQNRRFDIQPEVMIKTPDGVELAATLVRKKGVKKPLPAALQFTIYADEKSHIKTAIHAAAHGYVGIVANSRGKRGSHNKISPWEHDGEDADRVIDWVARQPYCDGRVVMYGGSYNGFTQWAATKHLPKALKTIVPYAAASPITGLPIENNIVITPNYPWAFFVTDNKTMDNSVYADWQKAEKLRKDLYRSGRPIVDIDKLDGRPNPWFQKWLKHPDYDSYYQAMLPFGADYKQINIPVLSITGYFDGGQISALDFVKRHQKNNPKAQDFLVIGPYDHGTAQSTSGQYLSNYKLDPVALQKDTEELAFAWFDHVLYGKPRPKLVKDHINYQLMGSNSWQHAPSLDALNAKGRNFYLTKQRSEEGYYLLSTKRPGTIEKFSMKVDMADRAEQRNLSALPVIQSALPDKNGLVFVTEPFKEATQFSGVMTGSFSLVTNKKDLDIGYNLYELTGKGEYFHLVNYISRASYAADMSKRTLLTPNQKTRVPLTNTYMTAKLLQPGSRLVLVLNVNKNENAQVNLGSGKPVNLEGTKDAGAPLTLDWFSDSELHLPLQAWKS